MRSMAITCNPMQSEVLKPPARTHHKPRVWIVLACAACRVLDLPRQPRVGSEGIVRVAGQRIPFALAANHERRTAKARPESLLQLAGVALEDDIGVGEERERGGCEILQGGERSAENRKK